MFLNTRVSETQHRMPRNRSETNMPHGVRHQKSGKSPHQNSTTEENAMSLISGISRLGASLAKAHRSSRAARRMNALPEELQKDIGWLVVSDEHRQAELFMAIWNAS